MTQTNSINRTGIHLLLRPPALPPPTRPVLMPATEIWCRGYNQAFTPHGMSQHIARSLRSQCRIVHMALSELNFNPPSLPSSDNAAPRSPSKDFVCDENRLGHEIPILILQPASQQFNVMINSEFLKLYATSRLI